MGNNERINAEGDCCGMGGLHGLYGFDGFLYVPVSWLDLDSLNKRSEMSDIVVDYLEGAVIDETVAAAVLREYIARLMAAAAARVRENRPK